MAQLGAYYNAAGSQISFSVFASRATRLELWLYGVAVNSPENLRLVMARSATDSDVFEQTVAIADLNKAGVTGTVYYGYRAWGPNWSYDQAWTPGSALGFITDCDAIGNRYNPNKLLLDPYARETSHDPLTPLQGNASVYLSGAGNRNTDSAFMAPKGVVLQALAAAAGSPARPTRPLKDEIIYEVHVRGLTQNDSSIPEPLRGTFAGTALKAPVLKQLGVTAVEFLPIQESQNETNDLQPSTQNCNYWGYEPYAFFAPDRRYAADKSPGGPTKEFKQMVDAFHKLDIKVYCDMIFNHGGEGDVQDADGNVCKIFTCRGLDNVAYYEVQDGNSAGHYYRNDNGVSANLNAAELCVRNLVIDVLKYWSQDIGVDGYRFDLAAVLGNTASRNDFNFSNSDPNGILLRALAELPVRPAPGGAGVDLIAEPYTANGYGQEQGNFPNGWAEWNDNFRDVFRASQNKLGYVGITPGQMAFKFAGSQDRFGHNGRKPWASINFITCHDGFALRDLYSFDNTMNNLAYPFGPSAGGRSADAEMCWDQGGDPALQRQAIRNGLALALMSAGVPMFCGGDEFLRTQYGNNNMFNVDTDKNWLDYAAGAAFQDQTNFVGRLIAFRLAHACLRPAEFFSGADHNQNGLKDLTWYTDSGAEISPEYFNDATRHYISYRIDGSEFGDISQSILVMYNGWSGDIAVHLPQNLPGKQWYLAGDTSSQLLAANNFYTVGSEQAIRSATYYSVARSVVVMVEK
ncbi:MAG: alpha-amylase family glycosyl hydrolase [Methylomonas sp.]|jgi:glycogen operon protein